ncbi:mCG1028027, partial [Mus musculus]
GRKIFIDSLSLDQKRNGTRERLANLWKMKWLERDKPWHQTQAQSLCGKPTTPGRTTQSQSALAALPWLLETDDRASLF